MKIQVLISAFILATVICFGQSDSARNKSLDFDGSEDLVTSPLLNDTIYTIEFWIKSDVGIDGISQASLPFNFFDEAKYISLNNCCSGLNAETISLNNGFFYPSGPPTATDQVLTVGWHHIAFTSNGTTYNKIYIDGGLANMLSIESPVLVNTKLQLGYRAVETIYGKAPFAGKMDEIRLWKIERTEAEIQDNMNTELTGIEPNLILYYKMNSISPLCDIIDCSGNQFYGVRSGVDYENNLPQISIDAPYLNLYSCEPDVNCEEVSAIYDLKNGAVFSISPNPLNGGETTLYFNQVLVDANIMITNLVGQIVYQTRIQNAKQLRINLKNQTKGAYFVTLQNRGITATAKLIVN